MKRAIIAIMAVILFGTGTAYAVTEYGRESFHCASGYPEDEEHPFNNDIFWQELALNVEVCLPNVSTAHNMAEFTYHITDGYGNLSLFNCAVFEWTSEQASQVLTKQAKIAVGVPSRNWAPGTVDRVFVSAKIWVDETDRFSDFDIVLSDGGLNLSVFTISAASLTDQTWYYAENTFDISGWSSPGKDLNVTITAFGTGNYLKVGYTAFMIERIDIRQYDL
ncbi:hypothetical protein IIA79_03725 [bacterium]|nr:hypothetical protein [bacterium]